MATGTVGWKYDALSWNSELLFWNHLIGGCILLSRAFGKVLHLVNILLQLKHQDLLKIIKKRQPHEQQNSHLLEICPGTLFITLPCKRSNSDIFCSGHK